MRGFDYWTAILFAAQLYSAYDVQCADNNTICVVKQCNGRNTSSLTVRENCRCDPNCTTYGDCCIDSPYKAKTRKTFDCVKFSFMSSSMATGVYVKRSCSGSRYSWQCLSSKDYDEQVSATRIKFKIPVTTPSGITYGNQYCARCSKENDYNLWNISVKCESGIKVMSAKNFPPKAYIFNASTSTWNYVDANNKTENCTLRPSPPVVFRKSLRKCYLNMVQSCPPSASDKYTSGCANYTSVVTDTGGTAYRNEYCALCNNVPSSDLVCKNTSSTSSYRSSFIIKSTSTTSQYSYRRRSSSSTSSTTGPTSTAPPTQKPTTTVAATNSNASNSSVVTREFLHIYVQQNCMDFINSMTLTKMIVETKSTSGIKRSRVKSIVSVDNMPLRHCEEPGTDESEEVLNEESFALKFAVNSGVLASAVFTFLHLYDFFFTTSAATLTQKSMASYAIALAIGNVGFFVSNVAGNLCYLLGAITYFGFLTSFFWLSALAFDISCKVWSCVQEFDIFGKNFTNSQRFTAYSLISWVFPPVATFIMTYVAERNDDFILIGRVYETCWFQSDQTLLLFFVFPLTVTMSVNVAFYMFSAYVVWVQRSAAAKLSTKYGIDFKFHTGLIVISNLMWSVALTAMYYESSILWLCFAFLDAILGLLVYISSPVKHEISDKISGVVEKFVSSSDRSDIQNS